MYFPEAIEILNCLDETLKHTFFLEKLRLWYRELLISILVNPVVIWELGLFSNRPLKEPCFLVYELLEDYQYIIDHKLMLKAYVDSGLVAYSLFWTLSLFYFGKM